MDKLKSCVTEGVMLTAVYLSILAEIPSGPLDLETSKPVRSSHNIVSSLQRISSGGLLAYNDPHKTVIVGSLDSLESGTVERWNGMVERWNSGMGNYD